MNIVKTEILDVDKGSVDQAKVQFANKVIDNIKPVIDEISLGLVDKMSDLEKELIEKKLKVREEKVVLEKMMAAFSRKKKIKKLLERIEKLVNSGILSNSHSDSEMVVLLKVIDKLPEEKLDYHLKSTMTIMTKRMG